MHLYKMCVSKDHAWSSVKLLGDLGMSHFIELNANKHPFSLPFTLNIKTCKSIENKLDSLL